MSVQLRRAELSLGKAVADRLDGLECGGRHGIHVGNQLHRHLVAIVRSRHECKAVTAASNGFDLSKTRHENLRRTRIVQFVAHGMSPLPRVVNASLDSFATRAKHRYPDAHRNSLRPVNIASVPETAEPLSLSTEGVNEPLVTVAPGANTGGENVAHISTAQDGESGGGADDAPLPAIPADFITDQPREVIEARMRRTLKARPACQRSYSCGRMADQSECAQCLKAAQEEGQAA